jgi:hypothetical protein
VITPGYDHVVLWLLVLVGALLVGVAVLVTAGHRLRWAGRELRREVRRCLDVVSQRTEFFDRLGRATEWSRPDRRTKANGSAS